MVQRLLPAYFFSLECLLLYLLLFLTYTRMTEIPPLSVYFAIIIVGNILLYFALQQRTVNGTIPFISALIIGVIGYLLKITPMSIVLCTVYFYFRMGAFIKDPTLWKEERSKFAITFYVSSMAVFVTGGIFGYPHMNWLFGLVIVFTVLYIIGRFLQQIDGLSGYRSYTSLGSVLGIGVLLTGTLTLIVPIVKWMFFKITTGLALMAVFVGSPLFYMFSRIEAKPKPKEQQDPFEQIKIPEKTSPENFLDKVPVWAWVMLLLIILFVIWYFIRKRRFMADIEAPDINDVELKHMPMSSNLGLKPRFFREPAPNEYIRKLIYQLQIYAAKYNMGRYEHETIREWFQRVGVVKNEELLIAYESVRYGNASFKKSEVVHLDEVVKNIKREIKDRNNQE